MRRALIIAGLALVACGTGVALAATLHHSGTYRVAAGRTRSIAVPFPDALEYGGARYSGTVTVLAGSVKVLSRGSCLGGSEYCVKVRNRGRAVAKVRVTATTRL